MKYCTKCGAELVDGAKFCDKCGQATEETGLELEAAERKNKVKWIAIGVAAVVLAAGIIIGLLFATGVLGGGGSSGADIKEERIMRAPGLYGDGGLLADWDSLMENGYWEVEDGVLMRLTDYGDSYEVDEEELDELQNYSDFERYQSAIDRSGAFSYDFNSIDLDYDTETLELVLPSTVNKIGDGAFCGWSDLTGIEIPNSVTSIGALAFCECESLTGVKIPGSVESIGSIAFCECENLTSVVLPYGLKNIKFEAFACCEKLSNIVIPSGVTSIGNYAFSGCSSLKNVAIPTGTTDMGYGAFAGSGLFSIVIPESVTSIGDDIFDQCDNLQRIEWKGTTYSDTDSFTEDFYE